MKSKNSPLTVTELVALDSNKQDFLNLRAGHKPADTERARAGRRVHKEYEQHNKRKWNR
ncbi:MAG: hypothetical protein GY696_21740 [Gammaproteobacteria bacterium]|nr:hypothetical protein [Gammaproteobacteria bacterium]